MLSLHKLRFLKSQKPFRFYSQEKRKKIVDIFQNPNECIYDLKNGQTLFFGGFGLCGVPDNLIKAIHEKRLNNLTVISNEGGIKLHGLDLLIESKQVVKIICSFLGENKNLENQFIGGDIEIELVPQGSFAERIRAAGSGLPAFFTPTGVNTILSNGEIPLKYDSHGTIIKRGKPKEHREINGVSCILEEAIRADFALIKGWKADKAGNIIFRNTAFNFNAIMAKAAKITIAEVEEIVEIGDLDPNFIHLPGIYVDRIVKTIPSRFIEKMVCKEDAREKIDPIKERICRRAALEFKNATYANLGIGLPMLVPNYIPKSIDVFLHAENGLLGLNGYPSRDKIDSDLINPGKEPVTAVPGASFFGSDESFSIIRGQHLDFTMLGAIEVSQYGDLANWMIPGKMVKGMGGAMDLVANKMRVIILTTHEAKNGQPKIVKNCRYPLTGTQCVDTIITEKCVFKIIKGLGMILEEIADGLEIDDIYKSTGCHFHVPENLKRMGQIEN